MATRFAVIGDIHTRWTDDDVRMIDEAAYDGVLVVGDLAGLRFGPTAAIARSLATLQTRTLLVPGNHDASHAIQLLAEAIQRPSLGRPFASTQARNLETLREAFRPHELAAWSSHRFGDVTVIAGRPHSMGGPTLSFADHLQTTWEVDSLEASTERLVALVDAAETDRLVFVAHNGPAGLGTSRSDIWGCDFRASEGDWGDPDLTEAIAHAVGTGRQVLAVCAGHMHRRLRGGGQRVWKVERGGTLYVNAAEVPRIDRDGRHHHVRLTLEDDRVLAEDVWL